MATLRAHNKKSSAVKRIMQEAKELAEDPCTDYTAAPLEDDIFEWGATIRGAPGTDFEGGLYRVRILLPAEYPFKAPDLMILTPNGRFETNKKICIDGLTSFHAGSWQPAWGVRTAIVGLMSFWQSKGEAMQAIGALDYPTEERKRLAKLSRSWKCPNSGLTNLEILPDVPPSSVNATASSSSSQPSNDAIPPLAPEPAPPASLEPPLPPSSAPPTVLPSADISLLSPPTSLTSIQPIPPPEVEPQEPIVVAPPAVERPPLPTVAISQPPAPLWFDACFGVVLLAVGILLARRLV
ncbi:ubiquitin-conjugating enzyme/RWD-like protein [Mrakia frigida]|uniref:ubiquitin-conjugating enzyme E2 n=1 Tax=Mrakia frigida TaxID=29902 RepID=UPI003FCBF07C